MKHTTKDKHIVKSISVILHVFLQNANVFLSVQAGAAPAPGAAGTGPAGSARVLTCKGTLKYGAETQKIKTFLPLLSEMYFGCHYNQKQALLQTVTRGLNRSGRSGMRGGH